MRNIFLSKLIAYLIPIKNKSLKYNYLRDFSVLGVGIEPTLQRNTSLSRARLPIPPSEPLWTANIVLVYLFLQLFFQLFTELFLTYRKPNIYLLVIVFQLHHENLNDVKYA